MVVYVKLNKQNESNKLIKIKLMVRNFSKAYQNKWNKIK